MTLQLSVPSHSTRVLSDVERRPGKVEKWLAALPLLNIAETGHKLYTTLNTYNRIDLDPELRLKLLELYRTPIRQVGLALQKQYVGMPLPLPERNKNIAEQHRDFYTELAYGYKQVVLAHAQTTRPKNIDHARDLALPIQRTIRHLTEVLLTSHLSYSPAPPSTWKEIHALYRHAEQLSIVGVPVDDSLNSARGRGTVAEAYKQALLLDLSDPYHLPSHLTVKIDQYLEGAAELAMMRPATPPIEPNCQFLIDLEGDRAGIMHSATTVLEQLERYRVLNTFELARTIHAQLMQLQAAETPQIAGLPADFFKDNGHELLLRLINVWGVNPKRGFRRSERADTTAEVAIGLDAVNYWLNGGRRLERSAGLVGPEPERNASGTFGGHQVKTNTAGHEFTAWDIVDESAGGMALSKSGAIRRRVRVGDLIATRFVADDSWTISVARWVKSSNPSSVEMGIQRLAPSAQAVLVKAVAGEKEESDFLAALRLPAIAALKEPETLLIPTNLFRPDRTLYVDDGTHLSRVITKQVLEAASGFDRVEFIVDMP